MGHLIKHTRDALLSIVSILIKKFFEICYRACDSGGRTTMHLIHLQDAATEIYGFVIINTINVDFVTHLMIDCNICTLQRCFLLLERHPGAISLFILFAISLFPPLSVRLSPVLKPAHVRLINSYLISERGWRPPLVCARARRKWRISRGLRAADIGHIAYY